MFFFILQYKTLISNSLFPQKIIAISSRKYTYFYLIFPHPFYRLFYLSKHHFLPTPLLSFCQNHHLKLPFSATQLTKLSKTRFSASKYPHNKLYTKQISTKSAHSCMPHPEEERQEYLLFRSSKAGFPMTLALHLGQFRKPLW